MTSILVYIVNRKKLAVKIETAEDDDSSTGQLRLPKSSSIAAMPQQPVMKPKPQPESAVFAYSIGRGRGAPVQDNAVNGKHSALLNWWKAFRIVHEFRIFEPHQSILVCP